MIRFRACILLALWLGGTFATPAGATDPYGLSVTVTQSTGGDVTRAFGYSSIDEALFKLAVGLSRDFPGYNEAQDAVAAQLNMRGLPAFLAFQPDGTVLTFSLPGLPIALDPQRKTPTDSISFAGETRSESVLLLRAFLKRNPRALKVILAALARRSPIDPLAGNPMSLMTRKMKADFRDGFTHKVSQIWGCGTSAFNFSNEAPIQVAALGATGDIFADAQRRAAEMRSANQFGAGLGITRADANGYRSTAVDMPLSYTAHLDRYPGHKLRFDLPLSYVDAEGATSYSVGLGVAYTYPMSEVWTLTPGLGIGATSSDDLGAAGGVGALSLTSAYTWRLGNYALSMGNSIGQYDSLPIKIGSVEAEAEIGNLVFTNGLLLTGPNSLLARDLVMEFSLQDTRLSGDDVYSRQYNELGVALGLLTTDMGVIKRHLKGGVSYLVGENDIRAIKLSVAARF